MNKKNKQVSAPSHTSGHNFAAEYAIIRRDLLRVALLNALYLALILGLYYSNLNSGFLERLMSGVVKI